MLLAVLSSLQIIVIGWRMDLGFAFLMLRLGRLYPLHVVMLFVFVATEFMLYLLGDIGQTRE